MVEERKTVLVYGASGVRGGPVARRLLAAGQTVRLIARDPAKVGGWAEAGAEIVEGDFGDADGLKRASWGVDAVALHLPLVYDRSVAARFVRSAVDAAVAAGVGRVVFQGNSRFPDETTDVAGFEIDRDAVAYVHASPIPSVVLRPTVYMDNFAGPWTAPGIVRDGEVAYPIPVGARTAYVSADDAAAVVVAALGRTGLDGATLDLAGPERLSGDEVADRFARVLNRPVRYQQIPLEGFEQGLAAAVGEAAAREIVKLYRWGEERGDGRRNEVEPGPLLAALPVKLTALDEWIGARPEFGFASRESATAARG